MRISFLQNNSLFFPMNRVDTLSPLITETIFLASISEDGFIPSALKLPTLASFFTPNRLLTSTAAFRWIFRILETLVPQVRMQYWSLEISL